MSITVVLALVVFKQRKCKVIINIISLSSDLLPHFATGYCFRYVDNPRDNSTGNISALYDGKFLTKQNYNHRGQQYFVGLLR